MVFEVTHSELGKLKKQDSVFISPFANGVNTDCSARLTTSGAIT